MDILIAIFITYGAFSLLLAVIVVSESISSRLDSDVIIIIAIVTILAGPIIFLYSGIRDMIKDLIKLFR